MSPSVEDRRTVTNANGIKTSQTSSNGSIPTQPQQSVPSRPVKQIQSTVPNGTTPVSPPVRKSYKKVKKTPIPDTSVVS